MVFMSWRKWLDSLSPITTKSPTRLRRRAGRLHLESLESRLAPAVRTWTGLGATNLFSNPGNWNGGTTAPSSGDSLTFPAGASQLTASNDFSNFNFQSISFTGGKYTIGGNAITLGSASGINNGSTLSDISGATTNHITLNVSFAGSAGTEAVAIGSGTVLTIDGTVSGAAGVQLVKQQTGSLVLTNDNSGMLGPVTISQGTLQIQNANGVGPSSQNITVIAGAGLQLANVAAPITKTAVLNGSGFSGNGAIENVAGNNIWSGSITLGSSTALGSDAGQVTFSGALSDGGFGYGVTKVGASTVVLQVANNYSGNTIVAAGTLLVTNAGAIGTVAGQAQVQSGGALALQNTSITNKLLVLTGTGIGNTGALVSTSGNNSWTGNITLQGTPLSTSVAIGVNGGSNLTLSGVIRDGSVSSGLNKEGAGELILNNPNPANSNNFNTYSGGTLVDQGTLSLQGNDPPNGSNGTQLGKAGGSTTVNSRATLEIQVDVFGESLTLNGPGVNNNGALFSTQNTANAQLQNHLWTGNINLASPAGIGVNAGSRLTVTGVISGPGSLTKFGAGALFLPTANTYQSSTIIDAGRVDVQNNHALGNPLQETIVNVGGELDADPAAAGGSLTVANLLELAGSGINNGGAINNISAGFSLFTGDVLLIGNASLGAQQTPLTNQLTLSGDILTSGAGFGLKKVGQGEVILSGNNVYNGTVEVAFGVLDIESNTALGATPNSAIVDAGASLYVQGADVGTGESLSLFGSGYAGGGALHAVAGSDTLWNGPVTFFSNVTIGAEVNSRVTIAGSIGDNNKGYSVTLVGGGQLALQGANTYGGGTNVLQGILDVENSSALGSGVVGTTVSNGASLEVQNGINVANQNVTVLGTGPSYVNKYTQRWFPAGPAPINNAFGQINQVQGGPEAESGRVTGVASDPTNAKVLYLTAAGGGVWKSKDGGQHWFPLTDNLPASTVPLQDLAMGAMAVAPSNPLVIYAGEGEANNSSDSFYGDGVLKSTDGGLTWTLLGTPDFFGLAISKIVVSPVDPNVVYAATCNTPENASGFGDDVFGSFDGGATWTPLIAASGALPFSGLYYYTDLVMDPKIPTHLFTGVFTTIPLLQPKDGLWESFDGGFTWAQDTLGFPNGAADGWIKLAINDTPAGTAIYGSVTDLFGDLSKFVFTPAFGIVNFNTVKTAPPDYLLGALGATFDGFLVPDGFYADALTMDPVNPNIVYAGGTFGATTGIIESLDAGNTWHDIGTDSRGFGPHGSVHAMTVDASGQLLVGTDGGIWLLNSNNPANISWTDLNTTLQISEMNGTANSPSNPNLQYAGGQGVGTSQFNGTSWNQIDAQVDNFPGGSINNPVLGSGTVAIGSTGQMYVDPNSPNLVYEVAPELFTSGFSVVNQSADGGKTWNPIDIGINLGDPQNPLPPLAMDSVNTSTLLFGTNIVYETVNQGASWTPISQPFSNGWDSSSPISALGISGGNPNVIYAATDDGHVLVTINGGTTWADVTPPNIGAVSAVLPPPVSSIAVDPNHPGTAYMTVPQFTNGTSHVLMTTNFGSIWTDITSNLPNIPVWTVLLDPRPNPNILYVGTDNGVFVSYNVGQTWQQFGVGMPAVQVRQLDLNTSLEYISAATYGRGIWELSLDPAEASAGGMRVVSGTNSWSGNITMTGNTVLGAEVTSTLELTGSITDSGHGYSITKIGEGTVVLANANTYSGNTTVVQGVLNVQNSGSLGTGSKVTVNDGAVLQLQGTNLTFPSQLSLFIGGTGFNSVTSSGALENVFGVNTWQGAVTLTDNTAIGVDADTLTIAGTIGDGGNNLGFAKSGNGTLVLASADTYSGTTTVLAGTLNIQDPQALGIAGANNGTIVDSGAELDIAIPSSKEPATILNSLTLFGVGIDGNGVLKDIGSNSNDTWAGGITLLADSTVSVDAGDNLTASNQITDLQSLSSLTKEGAGRLILTASNVYTGGTVVNQGQLQIQSALALGPANSNTVVNDGGTLELANVNVSSENVTINGAGSPSQGALDNVAGDNTWTGQISLGSSAAIGVEAGTSLIMEASNGGIAGNGVSLLSKVGPGTLFFPTPNSYQGQTLVFNGVLNVSDSGALGDPTGQGTFVSTGGTLQIDESLGGPVTFTKSLQLTGFGFNGMGALTNEAGNNVWGGTVILSGPASVNIDSGNTLTFTQSISEVVVGSNLTLVGPGAGVAPGSVLFTGGAGSDNTFTGTTFVTANATLYLDKTQGALALTGNLTVGDGTLAPGTDVVVQEGSNQFYNSSTGMGGADTVTVNGDGAFNLNNSTDQIGGLNIVDGTFQTGTSGTLTIAGPTTFVGGMLQTGGAGSSVTIGGDVTAQSDAATGAAQITGGGTLSLGAALRNFTVNVASSGSNPVDMQIAVPVTGTGSSALTKNGTGVLELEQPTTYAGLTTVTAGTLMVDAASSIGAAQITGGTLLVNGTAGAIGQTGGTLSGTGTVGAITSNGGTIAPGPISGPGTLTSGSLSMTSFSNYNVTLAAGGIDELSVTGAATLNGNLNVTLGSGFTPAIGASFTLIHTTGGTTGNFIGQPEGSMSLFIAGERYQITYKGNAGSDDVVITRIKADSTTTVTSSVNPSAWGQPVTFTATIAAVAPGTGIPAGNVQFFIDNVAFGGPVAVNTTTGQAISAADTALTVGNHTVTATFTDSDGLFFGSSGTLTNGQTVKKADTTITVVANPSNPSFFGESVNFTVTVAALAPGAGTPQGTVQFSIDGSPFGSPVTLANGTASSGSINTLPAGNHSVTVSFSDSDGDFNSNSGGISGGLNVNPANTLVAVSSSTNPSFYGQAISFSVTVSSMAPGVGTPTGQVQFQVDGANLGVPVGLSATGTATSISISSLTGGNHVVKVVYTNVDGNYASNSGILTNGQTVQPANTQVQLGASSNPASFGQTIFFTATLSSVAPGAGTPTGTVQFVIDGAKFGSPVALNGGVAQSPTTSTLSVGLHTITANFVNSDGNFANGSGNLAGGEVVQKANTSVALSSSAQPAVFGQSVFFTADVTAVLPGVGTPGGTVQFKIDGTNLGSPVTLVGGTANSITTSAMTVGTHVITAVYRDTTGNFNGSTGTLSPNEVVNPANTTVVVAATVNPVTFGQSVKFTVVVTATKPGSGTPTGIVQFQADGNNIGTPVALVNGKATSAAINTLSAGNHVITADYANLDGNFNNATGTLPTGETVKPASTSTIITSSLNPSTFGQAITFKAVVATLPPGKGTATGSVQFTVDGTNLGSPVNLIGNTAISSPVNNLPVGNHTITATYVNTDGNFLTSSATLTGGQTINKASSTVTVTSSANPAKFGQGVVFTALVQPVSPATVTPAGNVQFVIDGQNYGGPVPVNPANGQAVSPPDALFTVGTHTVTANYINSDGNFNTSSGSLAGGQVVNKADTGLTITSSANPAKFGQSITFKIVVAAVSPGAGVPAGTVQIQIDGVNFGSALTLSGGSVTSSATNTLSVGNHTITATFTDSDNDFNASNSTLSGGQNVFKSDTTTAVTASANPAVFGQPVTFTATVAAVSPGAGVPGGTVQFQVDGTNVGSPVALTNGSATSSAISTLGVGNHIVTASYTDNAGDFNTSSGTLSGGLTVNQAGSKVAVSSSVQPSVFGQSVTFTATVTAAAPGAGTPTGTVTFQDNGVTLSTVNLSNGSATGTFSLVVGSHAITVQYSGDKNFVAGSGTLTNGQTVKLASTAVAVVSSQNPSTFGQAVISAQVSVVAPGAGVPTGTVTFTVDGTASTPVGINSNGTATLPGAPLGAGKHQISVTYSGDGSFATSSSSAFQQVVNPAGSTTTLLPSANPTGLGQPLILTATVAPVAPGTGTASGNVTLLVDGSPVQTLSLNSSGQAAFTISSLLAGNHTLAANYLGSTNLTASTSANLVQVISQGTVGVVVSSSANPAVTGQGIIFTVTVAPNAPATVTPTGNVTLSVDGGAPTTSALGATGKATFNFGSLLAGTHNVVAQYGGDTNYQSGKNGTVQTVSPDSTTTTIKEAGSLISGRTLTFTATVTANAPGSGTPTGTVTFQDGVTIIGTAPVSGGTATLSVQLPTGTQTVTATYSGDANFSASVTSPGVSVTVLSANQAFVSKLYVDLLNRPVDPQGLAAWSALLGTGTPRSAVVFDIESTPEYRGDVVTALYERYLHRAPDPAGFQGFVTFLNNGGTDEQVADMLIGSQEYFNNAGGTLNGFLTNLYQDVLNRPIDPGAYQALSILYEGGLTPRSAIADIVVRSQESYGDVVRADYLRFLRRNADSIGLNNFVNALLGGATDEQVIAAIAGSDEYFANL
jgi:autotransporter-associated beta strand protein